MAELLSHPDEDLVDLLSPGRFRFLRYWSLNMKLARGTGQGVFPGFSYDADEQARMDALAAGASATVIMVWLAAVVAAYLLVAIASVVAVIGAALVTVWRDVNDVPEAEILAAIALILVMMIGFAMPLSISAMRLIEVSQTGERHGWMRKSCGSSTNSPSKSRFAFT